MCPYYFSLPETHIREYFARVASSVDIDILLYNFPARNNVTYSPEMILSLAADHKNIVGIKDSGSTLEDMRRYISEVADVVGNFSVFSGFDEFLVPNLLSGGAGTIGALPNFEPELFVKLRKAVEAGDLDTVRACQKRLARLMRLYTVTRPVRGRHQTRDQPEGGPHAYGYALQFLDPYRRRESPGGRDYRLKALSWRYRAAFGGCRPGIYPIHAQH